MTQIYYLTKINQDIPFYVGKTINMYSRIFSHKKTYGKDIEYKILDEVKDEEWLFWERYYIWQLKSWGFNLLNINNGGGGSIKATDETKRKISIAHNIPILQYDLEGNFIKEWNSAKEFTNILKLQNATLITHHLKNNIPSAYGFIWKYKTKNYKLKINPIVKNWETIPINQYDLEGNFIKEWKSGREIANFFNKTNATAIIACCKNKTKKSYGFIWKYK